MQWRPISTGAVLVMGCGIPTAAGYIQAAEQQAAHTADVLSTEQLQPARELPTNPPDVAVALTEFIGEDGPNSVAQARLMFSPTAAVQLTTAVWGTTDCPAAIQALHDQMLDPSTYINAVTIPPNTWSTNGDNAAVNGCAVTWNDLLTDEPPPTPPGPLPGRLTLTRRDGKGWLITGYQAC